MNQESEKPKEKGELQPIEFGGQIVSVYRKCTCSPDVTEGTVKITRKPDGTNVATCQVCGATLEWGGPQDKKE